MSRVIAICRGCLYACGYEKPANAEDKKLKPCKGKSLCCDCRRCGETQRRLMK